jgi:hypothetical protein
MTNSVSRLLFFISLTSLFSSCSDVISNDNITFYEVPLVCGAAPEIGCGSRIKPFFLDLKNESSVESAWTNRQGTVFAVKWKKNQKDGHFITVQGLFEKHKIDAELIENRKLRDSLFLALTADSTKWLSVYEVDSLSHYEAGVIAGTLTDFAREADLINKDEQQKIRFDIEKYFKTELVKVRTEEELRSEETQHQWLIDGFQIYQKHIGKDRAEAVRRFFLENEIEIMEQESCCSSEECEHDAKATAEKSTITCPKCGHKKEESLPTDICLIKYSCEKCKAVIRPNEGDCCVFCSHGDHKCPSKQQS